MNSVRAEFGLRLRHSSMAHGRIRPTAHGWERARGGHRTPAGRGLAGRCGVMPAVAREPVGHDLRARHAPLGGTSPVRRGNDEAVESGGSTASHGGDEVWWMATMLRGLMRHQRGKGWVRRGIASEEKAAQVELIEEKNDGGVFDVLVVGVAPVVSDGVSEVLQCCGAEMEVGLG
jgi:hypothetical protein